MENLLELASYEDEKYGTVVQFLDNNNNCIFYIEKIDEFGNRNLTQTDSETNRILEEKYFSMERDFDEYE
jgi:hypothetical protein